MKCSLWIPNREFHFRVPVLYMVYCSLAKDVAVSINTTYKIGCCNWFLMQPCTEVDDNAMCKETKLHTWNYHILFWWISYIQCGFSISCLSIPGIVAHDKCNISRIFTFSFQFQCRMSAVSFIYITAFQEDSQRDSVVGRWMGRSVGSWLFVWRFWPV